MATVYITKELLSRVKTVVHRMRNAEVASECPTIERRISTDCAALLNAAQWFGHEELLGKMPRDWLRSDSTPDLKVLYAVPGEEDRSVLVAFEKQTGFYYHPTKSGWGSGDRSECKLSWLEMNVDKYAGAQEIIDIVHEKQRGLEIFNKWAKVYNDVAEFLNKCKSLNEALKLLPSVKMYIDEDDIERVERKVTRTKREDVITVDIAETITAAAVVARLTGAV